MPRPLRICTRPLRLRIQPRSTASSDPPPTLEERMEAIERRLAVMEKMRGGTSEIKYEESENKGCMW